MRRTLCLLALVGWLPLAGGATAADKATINRRTGLYEPPTSDLRKAAERGDRAELSRAATRLGPARLGRLLADGDRKTVLAALEAAPLLASGVLLLEPMLALLSSSDTSIRAHAVTAVATIFAEADPLRLAEYEVPAETVLGSCRALAALAGQEAEQLGTRLAAIQGAVDGGPTCVAQLRSDTLLASREPEVRRAAVWALPDAADPRARAATQALLSAATKDPDGGVAGAAAARLCRSPAGKPGNAGNAGNAEMSRPLHALVRGALAEDLIELLPCLAASPDAADQKALAELAGSARAPIREAVKRLRETRPAGTLAESPAKKP